MLTCMTVWWYNLIQVCLFRHLHRFVLLARMSSWPHWITVDHSSPQCSKGTGWACTGELRQVPFYFSIRNTMRLMHFQHFDRKFFRSPNFDGWYRQRHREMTQKLECLHLEVICDAVSSSVFSIWMNLWIRKKRVLCMTLSFAGFAGLD